MPLVSKSFRALPGPKFTNSKRVDYLTRIGAIIHAILVTLIAAHACFYSCDSGKSIFQDDECRLQPKVYHALSALVTIGYLAFDFIATLLFNHSNTLLTY